jgi:hypothetical protein
MFQGFSIRLYATLTAALLSASPALAQFTPRTLNDPATGEKFHIEASAGFWNPKADMQVSSISLGIPGTNIDFKKDLGLTDKRFPELHLVLRPAVKHKFRLQYIPIDFTQTKNITRDITFNGQLYRVNTPVKSSLAWKAYRFAYEYDFLTMNRWFAGVILEAKYTDVNASLLVALPTIDEHTRIRSPIPAIGGIGRFYVVPNISITGELTGIKLPKTELELQKAHYADFDLYGTVNFTNNLGLKLGYRSFDVGYLVTDKTEGAFTLKGIYFGVVARY